MICSYCFELELFAKPQPIRSLEHKNKCRLHTANNVKLYLWILHMVMFIKFDVRKDHWMGNNKMFLHWSFSLFGNMRIWQKKGFKVNVFIDRENSCIDEYCIILQL